MRSIAVAVAVVVVVVLAPAALAAAQTPDPAPEPAPPRWTAGVSVLHSYGEPPIGVHVGWRMSDRVSLQADVVQLRESHGYDEYLGGEELRTIRWWTGDALYHFNGRGRIRPHLLAGVELMIDKDNTCALIRRMSGDRDACGDFPHRRPGVHGGVGVDIPFGSRFFARLQYLTSAVYVYEQVAVGHRLRMAVGVGF